MPHDNMNNLPSVNETSFLLGQLSADLKTMKTDFNNLFKEVKKVRADIVGIKVKVFGIGVAATIVVNALIFLKKWWEKG